MICPACGNKDIRNYENVCWKCGRPLNGVVTVAERRAARMAQAAETDGQPKKKASGWWYWAVVRITITVVIVGVISRSLILGLIVGAALSFVVLSARQKGTVNEAGDQYDNPSPLKVVPKVLQMMLAVVGMILLGGAAVVFVLFMICLALVGGSGGFH